MSLMFCEMYLERVSGLVFYGSYASMKSAPWILSREKFDRFLAALETHWGKGILVRFNAPSRIEDKAFMKWFGRLERSVASPSSILALVRANYEIDVSDLLPSIRVLTLILHRKGDSMVPLAAGQYLAANIPGAKYVELPGDDHLLQALDQDVLDTLLDQLEKFITGRRQCPHTEQMRADAPSTDMVESANHSALPSAGAEGASAADAIAEL